MLGKLSKTQLAASTLAWTGTSKLFRRLGAWNGLLAFAYHRLGVASGGPYDQELLSATPDAFDRQVAMLVRDFDVIAPADIAEALRKRKGRFALITFDDGYRDNYEIAFPILRSHGAIATFFVCTGFIDATALPWWDEIAWMVHSTRRRELAPSAWISRPLSLAGRARTDAVFYLVHLYKSLQAADARRFLEFLADAMETGRRASPERDLWMTWEMLRELRDAGMCIGGHTVTHPRLSSLSRAEQWREISQSARRIEEELGAPINAFSYPFGHSGAFNQDTRECLSDQRISYGFSYYGGRQRLGELDAHDIRRIHVHTEMSLTEYQAILSLPQIFAKSRPVQRDDAEHPSIPAACSSLNDERGPHAFR